MDETTTDATAVDEAQDAAELDAGFKDVEAPTRPEKQPPAEKPQTAAEPEPELVKITRKEWDEVRAAAAKTASYDSQLSRAFGTIGGLQGNLQRLLAEQKAKTPEGRKVEIPKDAFAAMERDFPELAQQTRSALEAALSGVSGTGGGDIDPAKIETMLASYTSRREIEALEDAHPDWREIVGAVNVTNGEQPDQNNPFRAWLGKQDAAYQARINGSESASVISRAITKFQKETAAPKPATTPRSDARAERIKAAVQPRGDNAGAAPGRSDEDEFEAGFKGR